MWTYLIGVGVAATVAFFYLNIYTKWKAAGGGFMAGVQANHQEKWKDVLETGEILQHWGTPLVPKD